MKIRQGFVSNSSSSSFIVIVGKNKSKNINLKNDLINDNYFYPNFTEKNIIIDSNFGNSEFGWETKKYRDYHDKIMWSYMQALYANRHDFVEMLTELIKEKTHCKSVALDITQDGMELKNCYIDHQSIDELSMFENKEILNDFIFNNNSYIQGGNDNE